VSWQSPAARAASANWGPIDLDESFYHPIIGYNWLLLVMIAIYLSQMSRQLFAIIAPGHKTLIIAINQTLLLQSFCYQ
jgi:hypothetical protein